MPKPKSKKERNKLRENRTERKTSIAPEEEVENFEGKAQQKSNRKKKNNNNKEVDSMPRQKKKKTRADTKNNKMTTEKEETEGKQEDMEGEGPDREPEKMDDKSEKREKTKGKKRKREEAAEEKEDALLANEEEFQPDEEQLDFYDAGSEEESPEKHEKRAKANREGIAPYCLSENWEEWLSFAETGFSRDWSDRQKVRFITARVPNPLKERLIKLQDARLT